MLGRAPADGPVDRVPQMTENANRCPSCGTVRESVLIRGLCARCLWKAFSDTEAELAAEMEPALRSGKDGLVPPTSSPLGGFRLPGFKMIEELGRGGMGIVYRARQEAPDREVALKMVLTHIASSPDLAERFRIEAKAVAALEHPNILPIYQVGEHDGLPWFSMKLAAGGTLARKQPELKGRWREIATLLATLADAVQFAHERGVLHRDLKPENILFDEEGRAYISDFGLAKIAGEEQQLTRSVSIFGTPNFVSPEVAEGGVRRATTASDIHALGAILFQLVAGRPPFMAESLPALMRRIADSPAPSPAKLVPGLPRALEIICLRCLEKDPAKRYPTARELAEDLRRWLEGRPILARPAGAVEKMAAWSKRNPALAGLSVVLLMTVIVGTAFLIRANRQLARALDRTMAAERTARENLSAVLREKIQTLRRSKNFSERSNVLAAVAESASIHPTVQLRNDAAAVLAWPDEASPDDRRVFIELAGANGTTACSFDVSPDGQWAVSGTLDAVHLWSVAKAKRIWTGSVIALPWNYVAFHPDGKSFLYSSRAFGIKRREFTVDANGLVKTGLPRLVGPAGDTTIMGYAANGRDWIVAAERSGLYINRVELWPDGDPSRAQILVSGETLTRFSLSPDGKTGASALIPAAELRLWAVGPSNSFRAFGPGEVVAKEFTPDGKSIVMRETRKYSVHDLATGAVRAEWPALQGIHALAKPVFSADGRRLAVAQGPDRVQLLDGKSFVEQHILISPRGTAVVDYRFTDGGKSLLVLTMANGIELWRLDRLEAELARLGVGRDHMPAIR